MKLTPRWALGLLVVLALTALLPVAVSAAPRAQGSKPYGGKVVQSFTNCSLTQVIGVVLDANGSPKPGVGVRLWWGDGEFHTTAGQYVRAETDASGWDFFLKEAPLANTWYVAVENGAELLSDPVEVRTSGNCDPGAANVVKVEFRMGTASAPPSAPSAPANPANPQPVSTGSTGEAAPPIQSGATCQTFSETGYQVCDDTNGRFLSAYRRYGLQNVGFPISSRYSRDGFITQAFQKAILQWRPESGTVAFANTFDDMHNRGLDQRLLEQRQTPNQLPDGWDTPGATFNQVVAQRQALLNSRPALRTAYFAASDPLTFFGLPTSQVQDMGNHYAIRLQRAVLQEWKENVPWARAGQVTIANGGDISKDYGLIPAIALNANNGAAAAVPFNNPVPAGTGGTQAPAAPAAPQPVSNPAPSGANLDPRLGALGVGVQGVNVAPGQPYWKVVEVIWHDEAQSEGRHAIQIDVLDSNGSRAVGQTVTFRWGGGSQTLPIEAKPFPEYGANFPMYAAGNSYSVSVDGLPSETIVGMGLGTPEQRAWTIHTEFLIKYQRAIR